MIPRSLVLDEDDSVHLWLRDLSVTSDPSAATVELEVGPSGTRYPAVWDDAAAEQAGEWTRTAHTTSRFGGSGTTTGVPLAAGTHHAKWVLTFTDGQVVTTPETAIYVR